MSLPYRQIHLDFHTSPDIRDVGTEFGAEAFAQTLQDAHVQSINLFAKCHHGYFYYPTAVGEMHPGLSFDLLGEQVKACRAHGIGVVLYTCVGWNERASERFPQWMQLSREGKLGLVEPFANYYYKWHNMCVGNPEYRDYLKAELREEIERFSPDGLWIDIITSRECVCPSCVRDMREKGMDPENPDDVRRHDRQNEIGFMAEIREFIRSVDPAVKVYYNGGPAEPDNADVPELSNLRKCEQMDYVDIESLPGGYWGYSHFPLCVHHLNYRDQDLTMMNGRFHLSWGDFGSLRNREALEYECFRGIASGTHVCIGDQLHPRGKLEPAVYRRLGEVFSQIEALEPWLEGTRKCAQIGVFLSNGATFAPGLPEEGAYRVFSELHQPIDFLDFDCELSRYRLVVLPDEVTVTPALADTLNAYIDAGGAVLVTGRSGLDAEGRLLLRTGVEAAGPAKYAPRYLRLDPEVFAGIPQMDYVFYEAGHAYRPLPGTRLLAGVVDPYFNRSWDHFCSHRQSPANAPSGEGAVFQSGNVITVSQPLFSEYARHGNRLCKDIVSALLCRVLPDPLIRCDLPNFVEVYVRSRGDELVLHVLNYLIQKKSRDMDVIEESVPLYGRHIRMRSDLRPVSVTRVPDGEPVAFTYRDGYIELEFPRLEGYTVLSIRREEG